MVDPSLRAGKLGLFSSLARADVGGALFKLQRVAFSVDFAEQVGDMPKRRSHFGMDWARDLLSDRQRALEQRRGLCLLALGGVKLCRDACGAMNAWPGARLKIGPVGRWTCHLRLVRMRWSRRN